MVKGLSGRLFFAFIICIIGGILFGYMASSIGNGTIERFDMSIIGVIQGMEMPWLTKVLKFFTWIGSGSVVAPVTFIAFFLLYFIFKYRQQAFLFVSVIAGTVLLNELLKLYFKRERPEIYRIIDAGGFSFPSGHTMMAFSLYTIITYVAWRNVKSSFGRVLLVLFATFMISMIAVSRIYLGVHYPSDIVGGLAASALWVTIAVTVYGLYQNRRESKKGRKHV